MNSIADHIVSTITHAYKKHFYTYIEKDIKEECSDLEKLESFIVSCYQTDITDKERAEIKLRIHEQIVYNWNKDEAGKSLEEALPGFVEQLNGIFNELPVLHVREQHKERFYPQKDDSRYIRFGKWLKRSKFHTGNIPLYTYNGLLKLFRKKPLKIHYPKHPVHVKNLATGIFKHEIIALLNDQFNAYYPPVTKAYLAVKKFEEDKSENSASTLYESVHSALRKELNELLFNYEHDLANKLENLKIVFENSYQKAGTFELPNKKYAETILAKNWQKLNHNWQVADKQWFNTFDLLFDEWRADLEFMSLYYKNRSHFQDLKQLQEQHLSKNIYPEIAAIEQFIQEGAESLKKESSESFKKALLTLHFNASRELDKKIIPSFIEKIGNKNLTNLLSKLEISVSAAVNELPAEHKVAKIITYDTPTPDEEIQLIAPAELVSFELLPAFQNKLNTIKSALFEQLNKVLDEANNIDHIITFGLNTARIEMDGGKDYQDAQSIANESLDKAATRLSDVREAFEQTVIQANEGLEKALEQLNKGLLDLTVNENVREIRLRITKAKAVQQTALTRKKLTDRFNNTFEKLRTEIVSVYQDVSKRVVEWRNRFILTAQKPVENREASDFLSESQKVIDGLPVIYRYLYQIEPLSDLELFEGRSKEIEQVQQAFGKWEAGNIGSTILLGEKWSGLTTLINYIKKETKFNHPIAQVSIEHTLTDTGQLIALLANALKAPEITTADELEKHLNESTKKIIIIEDIQRLFVRKVNGFGPLEFLCELITKTGRQIFWLASCTEYAWSYLDKTIGTSEYFGYQIPLQKFSDEQITQIIWKRNKVSGYKIIFEPNEVDLEHKSFKKWAEEEQQAYLRKKFFNSLNDFAKSNISMALLFWLLSTKKIDQRQVVIRSFKKVDLSFLQNIAKEKVFVLHALILHDGLTSEMLATILRKSESHTQKVLLKLIEDGILMQSHHEYLVNPLIYRTVTNLLRSKNLIH